MSLLMIIIKSLDVNTPQKILKVFITTTMIFQKELNKRDRYFTCCKYVFNWI